MKTLQELLIELNACEDARVWAADKSIEQVITECHRGDWLLWLASKVEMDFQTITLAKGLCANTVRHLMKDDCSIKAVDVAIAFGRGEATRKELNAAYVYAYAAAAYAAAAAAAAAAYAADAAARQQNQQETADICCEVFGSKLIELVNNKLIETNQNQIS
jgi:hypothetical protein